MALSDYTAAETAVWLTSGIGALNWGLQEAFSFNVVTELLGTGNAGIVYIAIGVAGALALADDFDVIELEDIA